jgi:hypothetical protein
MDAEVGAVVELGLPCPVSYIKQKFHSIRMAALFKTGHRRLIPWDQCQRPLGIKMRNTLAEQMFFASAPTTDMGWLQRNDRLVPNSDIARMKRSKEKVARRRLFNSNLMIGDAGSQMQIDL